MGAGGGGHCAEEVVEAMDVVRRRGSGDGGNGSWEDSYGGGAWGFSVEVGDVAADWSFVLVIVTVFE